MSKRHRKTKMFAAETANGFLAHLACGSTGYDTHPSQGRRPKGRHRRDSQKRAYYD